MSKFLVGLDFELKGASVDMQDVRSRCRLPTLILVIRSFWKTNFMFLEPSIYSVDHSSKSNILDAEFRKQLGIY